MLKACTGCLIEQELSAFPRDRRARDGLNTRCRTCVSAANLAYRTRYSNPANREPVDGKRCPTCREVKPATAFHRSNRRKDGLHPYCKECWADRDRRLRYGLEPDQFAALVDAHDEKCAICRQQVPLVVDHDHATGVVRGLLCSPCNAAVGLLGDDPARMLAAVDYLTADRPPTLEAPWHADV